MGLSDMLHKVKSAITIKQLMDQPYEQKYLNECKFIWKNYVPQRGQSNVLQGELLREIEKLRCEAQDNGNINWDDDLSYFCDFIKNTLCTHDFFSDDEKQKVTLIMDYLKDCGEYAKKWNNGLISDNDVNIERRAYIGDNLYDIVADAIGYLHSKYMSSIPYEINTTIKR